MMPTLTFLPTPAQRQRMRELAFYRMLIASALVGILPVVLLMARIGWHDAALRDASQLLESEYQALKTRVTQADAASQRIQQLQQQLTALAQAERQRARPAQWLHTLALAPTPGITLQQLSYHGLGLELRAQAHAQSQVQEFLDSLAANDISRPQLQDLRAIPAEPSGLAHIEFSALLPLSGIDTANRAAP